MIFFVLFCEGCGDPKPMYAPRLCAALCWALDGCWSLGPPFPHFFAGRKNRKEIKIKLIIYFFFSVEECIGPQNTTSNFHMVQHGNLALNRGDLLLLLLLYEPQWRKEHGQGWCVWELMSLSLLVTVTLTSNQPATGHSLWSCLWRSNTIERGRYLLEEKPRVASGGRSLVET